ncbi:uncharacterized protein LOC129754754 [Uranotaenia lowii]|uniref:uncharacterized protein LOC129754754 n=1 Tax=Uranotaenia lowii TaxID=190385 RepID=UPI00247950E6|nr:uncharacterized protein LOC129754754 [Uranotaenia lowii]
MNGLSTLNRLLGKKNKDVSKSTSNLTRSTTNLDSSSQYNKIVPLAAMNNAPFEQTFRITVLLPREQLYVARVGAKTRLAVVLDMICNDKLLDASKFLFRHPTDFHQGFELDLTIGEVGLNEIRLMSKKELEHLQNNEYRLSTSDIFRLHQKNIRESSVSSSDLSRTSRAAMKTTSPYSSTNSLNSMDSSGLSSSSRGGINGSQPHPPVAPTRKKRLAPRPPSQNSIPEKAPLEFSRDDHIFKEPQLPPYSKKNFHVSSPNLFNRGLQAVDSMNNNSIEYQQPNGEEVNLRDHHHQHPETVEEMNNIINTQTSYSTLKNRPTSMYIIREPPTSEKQNQENGENDFQRTSLNGTNSNSMLDIVNHTRTSSNSSEVKDPRDFQESLDHLQQHQPTPRQRLNSNARKSKAPAPPPRSVGTRLTTVDTRTTNTSSNSLTNGGRNHANNNNLVPEPKIVPTPSPRAPLRGATTGSTDSDTLISETDSNFSEERNQDTVNKLNAVNSLHHQQPTTPPISSVPSQNVSKVMLNVDQSSPEPTSAPASLVQQDTEPKSANGASTVSIKIVNDANKTPVEPQLNNSFKPSTPIVSKVHIVPEVGSRKTNETEPDRRPSNGGHSSDEDIKIYNIESGTERRIHEKKDQVRSPSPAEDEQWTYTLPAPPKFADSSIKSGEYDEKQRIFDLQSTFVDNTTIVTDQMTFISDETEAIRPVLREKVLMDESLVVLEENGKNCPSPTVTLNESDLGTGSSPSVTPTGGEILITSDMEDGYRGGSDLRESMIQTLEKRREKLKENELQELKEAIESGVKPIKETNGNLTKNESNVINSAKTNEEILIQDNAVVIKRTSITSINRSQSVLEPAGQRRFSNENRKSSEVINELAAVIRDDSSLRGVLSGSRKQQDQQEEIPGVGPNSLSNFKISTYSNGFSGENKENILEKAVRTEKSTDTVPPKPPQDEEEAVIIRRKISVDSIQAIRSGQLLSSDEEESLAANNQQQQMVNGGAIRNGSAALVGAGPVKRRSLTTVLNRTPGRINRSDSFHSTRSDYIQALASPAGGGGVPRENGMRLTPRSTSYISLIGAQRFENRFGAGSRRKSTSEVSICDSPSLQSLEVIKNILNTSRSNLVANEAEEEREVLPMAAIKRNSFTDISTLVQFKNEVARSGVLRRESVVDTKIEEVEVRKEIEEEKENVQDSKKEYLKKNSFTENSIISNKVETQLMTDMSQESKSDDEKLQNKQFSSVVTKNPQTTVVSITTTSTTVTSSGVSVTVNAQDSIENDKKWKYQGPPTINLSTWSERPKIDVTIKSDRDYRFGGSSTLPRGYRNVNNTTKISLNATPATVDEREDGVDRPDCAREHVPLRRSEVEIQKLPLEINRTEPVTVNNDDRLPIVRAVEYKKNVVPPTVAPKPLEKPYFYDTFSRNPGTPANTTATINRLSMGYQKFQPVVRGFKSIDEPSAPRPVSMIESTNISTTILKPAPPKAPEKPEQTNSNPGFPFGQNTLRRTGLKDKILSPEPQPEPKISAIQEPPIVALKAKNNTTASIPPPPPPKLTTPVVRGAIVKKQLPPAAQTVDPRSALLDAIRGFNKSKLRKDPSIEEQPSH